ncbi:MAG: ornithine cyclodeaminase family protein [Lachnospiraceae bacterium]|nr:ornithine cyclodeaminase family protein [Lachnospiraceae bacterium]
MKIIEKEQVREILQPKACIELMKEALMGLENGKYAQPPRLITIMPNTAKFGFMPAYVGEYFGAKVISAFAPNMGTKYPSHIGYVMLFESEHSTVAGMIEAGTITEIRTGAVSAAATDLLARKDAHSLALIGAGAQARSHLAAIREVREITSVTVYDLFPQAAEKFRADMEAKYQIPVTVCASVEEAVKDADIVCTVSPSKEPSLFASMVKPGTHINAVGTFTPVTREVSSDLVAVSRLYSDQTEAMKRESGEYLIPLQEGLIKEDHVIGSIGELLNGTVEGRTDDSQITLFDALGLVVEDVACAKYVYENSEK